MRGQHRAVPRFEHVEFAGHGPWGSSHYARWIKAEHSDQRAGFARIFDGVTPTGETGAPEISYNPIAREQYHTDWVADRTIGWLDSLDADDDWFCWMSFPDPHHPWDPPRSERHRVNWRDLDLPPGHPGSAAKIRDILSAKPAHWLAWYDGRVPNIDAAPGNFVPANLTHNQMREILALIHIENELIDEACGRVLRLIVDRGWDDDTDIFFTSDHGEFQGDLGLLYKGPYHVDALMRLPFIWRPAPSAAIAPAVVPEPVGQLDLAPTCCAIAGTDVPSSMDGAPLPIAPDSDRERALCEWDSQLDTGFRLRSIIRDGWVCTAYEPSRLDRGLSAEDLLGMYGVPGPLERIRYHRTEGELYRLDEDPHQWSNRWDDAGLARLRSDLVADLYDNLPAPRISPLTVEAMA
ncbi:MAG: sulfatase-like hydrolase/transferase [Actinomycetota bacterium]